MKNRDRRSLDLGGITEMQLLRKLVTEWHLSVPERNMLQDKRAKASLIFAVIESILRDDGWFPSGWRPETDCDGGVIELHPDGSCRIHWKAEVSYTRFELLGIQDCANSLIAANAWLRKMFPSDIDGVVINWDVPYCPSPALKRI